MSRNPLPVYVLALAGGAVLEVVLLALGINDGSGVKDLITIGFPAAALLGFSHPTFVLPFYFFIGSLKTLPVFQSIPGNLSVLMGLYVAAACGICLLRDRRHALSLPALGGLGLIAVLVLVAYARTQMPVIAHSKLMYLLTFVMVSFIAPMVLVVDRKRVAELFAGFMSVGALVLAGMFLATDRSMYLDDRMGLSGASSIVTGMALVMAAISALYWWVPQAQGRLARAVGVAFALACLFGVAVTGSRGPFLFGLAALLAGVLFYARAMTRNLSGKLVQAGLVGICLVLALSGLRSSWMSREFEGAARSLSMLGGNWQQAIQTNDRVWLMRAAADMIREKPLLGHGLGGYQRSMNRPDEWDYLYPHNQPLDLASEVGLPATLILLGLWGLGGWRTGARRLLRPRGDWTDAALQTAFLLMVFCFLEGLVSNDVFRARAEWGALGLAHAISVLARRET